MKRMQVIACISMLAACHAAREPLPLAPASAEPRSYTYREAGGQTLEAYVFASPARRGHERSSAILLFHGGGWSVGEPEWTFDAARRFAARGMVAIPVEYRLSQGDVTPIEALEDVCAAFAWTRAHAKDLGIDPRRVAGYGVSAGGHLVACAATIGCPTEGSRPDALLLWSPALDLAGDGWFQRKLQGRASAADYSPAQHVKATTPPTSIVHGARDTLTPLAGAKRYCSELVQAGGTCELNVYEDVGHLLTRNLANQESDFDPDPQARADGIAQHERFLEELGFIDGE
jgi:acetyl esterase/lipase